MTSAIVRLLCLCGLLLTLTANPVLAETRHVRPNGDNTKGDGSAAKPWKTIAHALSKAKPGDTVQLGAGTFRERVAIKRGGTRLKPVTLKGTRAADGTYQTVLDGSTPIEAEWQDDGDGVYKAQIGYNPRAMTAGGYAIWRCGDHAMESGKCHEVMHYGPNHEVNTNIGGPIKYWDGIDALFGHANGWTYVRFRNREHPRDMQVRAAPGGGVVTIQAAGIVVEHVKIVGGEFAVHVRDGARGAVIQDSYLTHGKWRILLDGGEDTVIWRNTITLDGIGYRDTNLPAGDWNNTSYARIVNRHRYDVNKFEIGDTETDDSSIELRGDTGTIITQNVIRDANAGLTFHGSTTNADVSYNQILRHSDNCVYINADWASVSFHHNLIADCDHLMRFQSTQQNMRWTVYANGFWQHPESYGKHIFMSPPSNQPGDSVIAIYHNSHAGSGWAVDTGSDGEHINLPFVHVANMFMGVDDVSSWGGVSWGTMEGVYRDRLWYNSSTIPDFKLPPGNGAVNNAQSIQWPGMTAEYYVDNQPDYGATQGGKGMTPPTGTTPPPAGDTTKPTVAVVSPTSGATVSGLVTVSATASDNVRVVGVSFRVNGTDVGPEGCCVSVDALLDARTLPNGPAVLTAIARDAAGNVGESAPVNITITGGTTTEPPDPPNPPTFTGLTCTGTITAVPGSVTMTCVPTSAKR